MHSKLLTDFKQMNVLFNYHKKYYPLHLQLEILYILFHFIQQIIEYVITKTSSSFLL